MQGIEYILCLFISSSKEQFLTLQVIIHKFGEILFRLSLFHNGDVWHASFACTDTDTIQILSKFVAAHHLKFST